MIMRGEERRGRAMLGLLPGPPCPPPPPNTNDLAGLPSCFFIEKLKLSLFLLDNFLQKNYAIYFLVFRHNKDRCQQPAGLQAPEVLDLSCPLQQHKLYYVSYFGFISKAIADQLIDDNVRGEREDEALCSAADSCHHHHHPTQN